MRVYFLIGYMKLHFLVYGNRKNDVFFLIFCFLFTFAKRVLKILYHNNINMILYSIEYFPFGKTCSNKWKFKCLYNEIIVCLSF